MELNPLTEQVRRLERELGVLSKRLAKARSDLRWLSSYDASAEAAVAASLREEFSELETQRYWKQAELRHLKEQTPQLEAAASKDWYKPGHWFADRSREKRALSDNRDRVRDVERGIEYFDQRIDGTAGHLRKVDKNLKRFAAADEAALSAEMQKSEQALPLRSLELENLRSQQAHVERLLEPRRDELQQHQAKVRHAEDNLKQARDLEDRMSEAANGYERKLLHDECSNLFGDSSPRAVFRYYERLRDDAARSLSDAEWQLHRELETASGDGREKVGGRSAHQRKVRSWIALAQIEAWLYENNHADPSQLAAAHKESGDLRRRLTQHDLRLQRTQRMRP